MSIHWPHPTPDPIDTVVTNLRELAVYAPEEVAAFAVLIQAAVLRQRQAVARGWRLL